MSSTMLYLHTLSPLHCGTGQGSGIIDLPVVRETTTNWPEVPGSSIKGVLLDACRDAGVDPEILKIVFGPDTDTQKDNPSENAGGVWMASAQMLCFPVRSFRGSFAWVTCPHALRRWLRDYQSLGHQQDLAVPQPADDDTILTTVATRDNLSINGKVLLEDFDLAVNVAEATAVDDIATMIADIVFPDDAHWRDFFTSRIGIVSDDLFGFLVRTATDVRARIRIDDIRKIVADGALWYQESVPMETIFTMPLRATPQGESRLNGHASTDYLNQLSVLAKGIERPIQVGGDASVGSGIVQARFDTTLLPADDPPGNDRAHATEAGDEQEAAAS